MATSGGGGAGASGSFNWAGAGLMIGKMGADIGAGLVGLGQNALKGAAAQTQIAGNIVSSWSRQIGYEQQSKSFKRLAGDALKMAGRIQEQGRQLRESRLNKLGEDKGRIIASAAGSGLDVSSATVNKTVKDTVKAAYNDSQVLAKNEREMSQQKVNERTTALENAVWAEHNAKVEELNQNMMFRQSELQAKATKLNNTVGIFNTVISGVSDLAGAISLGSMG